MIKNDGSDKTCIENNGLLQSGYGLIPRVIMRSSKLTKHDKLVYAFLASFAGATYQCFPGQKLIAKELGIGIATVNKAIKHLAELGLIKKEKLYEDDPLKKHLKYTLCMDEELQDILINDD